MSDITDILLAVAFVAIAMLPLLIVFWWVIAPSGLYDCTEDGWRWLGRWLRKPWGRP